MSFDLEALFGADTLAAAAARLKTDAAFRAEADADLNAAVKAHYGIDLPLPLKLVENADGTFNLLPTDETVLSDDELDLVAGGIPPRPTMKELGHGSKISFG